MQQPNKLTEYYKIRRNPNIELIKTREEIAKLKGEYMAMIGHEIEVYKEEMTVKLDAYKTELEVDFEKKLNNEAIRLQELSKEEAIKNRIKGDTPTREELLNLITPLTSDIQDGHTPSEEELLVLIRPLIPKVENGHTPTDKELLSLIKPLIPEVENGRTPTKKELIALIRPLIPAAKNGSPDTGNQIVDKINSLPIKPEAQIGVNHIKDIERLITRIVKESEKSTKTRSRVGGGGDIINLYDLSSQTDGSTVTFTVPKHRKSIMVLCSDFPLMLFENNGFTVNSTRTQITLTVANAPSQGSQLALQYVT